MPYLHIQSTIHPESSGIQYCIAVAYGRTGDKKRALEALKSAAAQGFSDAARIEKETGFEKLRNDPRYEQILEVIRTKKKSPRGSLRAPSHGHEYLDYFSAMVDSTGVLREDLSEDDLHPNTRGYDVMAPLAEAAIARALKR